MTIGVDLRVLQVGHQFRGIGESAKRTLNALFDKVIADQDRTVNFLFYAYEDDDPKRLLDIPTELQHKTISLGKFPKNDTDRSKAQKIGRILNVLYGNPIQEAGQCDVFLQFDYALGVPTNTRTVLIKHDIIPVVFWDKYFSSPWTHFKNRAARTTLRTLRHNYEYKRILRRSLNNATSIMCISESTKNDLKHHFHIPDKKMTIFHWGVSATAAKTDTTEKHDNMPTKPYLLFVGAIDAKRRMVDDLVGAFNNLKAQGHDIQLVLVGENFQSPELVPNEDVRRAIMDSSYKKDILLMGYISDTVKQNLYKNAIAFVFPTVYEGFGIPILESMLLECPIVAYKNSSIPEVGGEHVLYANDWEGIERNIKMLVNLSEKERQDRIRRAKLHASRFTWSDAGEKVYDELLRVARR